MDLVLEDGLARAALRSLFAQINFSRKWAVMQSGSFRECRELSAGLKVRKSEEAGR